ncbi:hypothetical protein DMB66_06820 [Actinoplanes sp. ATCC 53533]|nr:hypothetical protein DMB66_06820 [Actinoplanes sp. ATCC 53533]
MAGTIEGLAAELALIFAPLAERAANGTPDLLLEWVGLRTFDAAAGSARLASALVSCTGSAADLTALAEDLVEAVTADDGGAVAATATALLTKFAVTVQAVRDAADELRTLSADPALSAAQRAEVSAVADEFVSRVLGRLLVEYLEVRFPPLVTALMATGVVEVVDQPPGPAGSLVAAHRQKTLHADRLVRLVSDPVGLVGEVFRWGQPDFDGLALFTSLKALLRERFDIPAEILQPPGSPAMLEAFGFSAEVDPTLSPPGLTVNLRMPAGIQRNETLALGDWEVILETDAAFQADLEGTLRPLLDVELTAAAGTVDVTVQVSFARSPTAEPFLLLGSPGGSRLEARSLTAGVALAIHLDTAQGRVSLDPELKLALRGGKLVISSAGGDGFLITLLSGIHLESVVNTDLTWSPALGARFTGSGTLQVAIPVHVELGPLNVQTLYLVAGLAGSGVPVELSAGMSAQLGPLSAAVDRLGLAVSFSLPTGGGNLGPLDVGLAFKPPTGVGLAVNAGVVTGGGFLKLDPAAGEYAGALELEFAEFLALKAIGLITTRMPDGSAGFSLLLVITAEFPGGLQLGYGFKLIGVGGVLGLHRGMRLDAIMEGVRTGAIESVMFPHDVVANAPRILSDLKAFFPPEDGVFVIGPMAKLGWGTPTIVTVSLGIIIEIPGNIALVGVLKVALPTEDEAILLLQVNFAGAIEFDKKRIYFFASLFHSRILTISIEGELGLLVAYGDQPDFVLSVGGFHPAFKAPPLPFPVPKRISINLLNSDVGRLGVDGYFAVTSNTAQFGAHAELYLGLGAFSVEGHLGFDALFQFSPFTFVIEISAGVSVKVFGVGLFSVSLEFTLSGPTPWQATGSASISLLFFSIGVDFDITWGEPRDTALPPINVVPLVKGELDKPESWRVNNPAGGAPLVTLRPLAAGEADIVLHPLGTVVVQQRAVPLDIRVDKVGAEAAADVSSVRVVVDGGGLVKLSDAADMFAVAQFQNLSDAEKLSLPSFEREHAGVELAADGTAMTSARAVRRSARYEQVIIDDLGSTASSFVPYNAALFQHLLAGASVARSPLAQTERVLRQPFADGIVVTGDTYVVAATRDNTARTGVFSSQAQARAHLDALVAADPNLIDAVHVIPAMEAAP